MVIELGEFSELQKDQERFKSEKSLMRLFFLDTEGKSFIKGADSPFIEHMTNDFGHFQLKSEHFIYTKREILDTAGEKAIGKVLLLHNLSKDKEFSEGLKKLVKKHFVFFIADDSLNTSFQEGTDVKKYINKRKETLFASHDRKYICQSSIMASKIGIKGLTISLFRDMGELTRYLVNTSLIGLAFILSFTVFFSILTYFSIKKVVLNPLNKILDATKAIMGGDLSIRVELRTWEISNLGSSFDYMTANLQKMIDKNRRELTERRKTEKRIRNILKGVVKVTEALLDSSRVANETSATLKSQAQKQTESLVDINNFLDKIETHATGNAQDADNTHKLVVDINQLVNKGSTNMKENIDSVNLVHESIDKLAINAAVEAAKAGK